MLIFPVLVLVTQSLKSFIVEYVDLTEVTGYTPTQLGIIDH